MLIALLLLGGSAASTVESALGATAPGRAAVIQDAGAPALTISPTFVNFGKVTITHTHYQHVSLTNSGNAALNIRFIGIEGINRGEFGIYSNTCGTTLQPGAVCTLKIGFSPYDYGQVGVEIYITDNAGNSPQTVLMYGFGIN